jgi:protein-tyrosine-phosphatase
MMKTLLLQRFRVTVWLLIGVLASPAALAQSETSEGQVVFVCEHGSVKSVMAAALFNQTAQKRGMTLHAVSRGVSPDSNVPQRIVDALQAEGIDVAGFKPQQIAEADTADATRVVAIGLNPESSGSDGAVEYWTDVPDSTNYPAARAALQRHIDALLDELQAAP